MTSIALATAADLPDLIDDDDPFLAALSDRGVTVTPAVWSDESIAWDAFDAVLVRSIWDYYRHPEAFAAWVDRLESVSTPVMNPPATLRWNRHKFYLRDLEARGVDTLPTEYVARSADASLASIFEDREWDAAVVKPAISAGAFQTKRISREQAVDEQSWFEGLLADRDVLVQEFAGAIHGGEWSLVFFGGEYSHAVLKRPEAGDFRVQSEHGGSVVAASPGESLRNRGRDVVEAVASVLGGTAPLYARVDGITPADGNTPANGSTEPGFRLLEVELIEPELFFRTDERAAERFAAAVLDRL